MGGIFFAVGMIPIGALFVGIGIYAWKRKEPMWFWAGIKVNEKEIADVPAYNRANGLLWIGFSMVFWVSALLGLFQMKIAGPLMILGIVAGSLAMPIIYNGIYNKYRKK